MTGGEIKLLLVDFVVFFFNFLRNFLWLLGVFFVLFFMVDLNLFFVGEGGLLGGLGREEFFKDLLGVIGIFLRLDFRFFRIFFGGGGSDDTFVVGVLDVDDFLFWFYVWF